MVKAKTCEPAKGILWNLEDPQKVDALSFFIKSK
jgi:hypothetical protein